MRGTAANVTDLHGSIWDAIVIGAGPAGSLAARSLAKSGLQTLLVERRPFPRTKVCGGCVNLRSLTILDSVGLGGLVRSLPGEPLSEFRLQSNGGPSLTLPLPGGLAVSRSTFDAALAKEAVEAGATFLDGVSVEVCNSAGRNVRGATNGVIDLQADARTVILHRAGNPESIASGRVIVAADGLGHPSLGALSEFQCRVFPESRIGVGALMEDLSPQYRPGTIYMAVGPAGYVGIVRVEQGLLNVAGAIGRAYVQRSGGPSSAVEGILKESDFHVPEQLATGAWQGTVPLTRRTVRPAGHRILVIGDSAGYVEPFTGEGIAWALEDGTAVGDFALRGSRGWTQSIENDWITAHQQHVVRRQWMCRTLTGALRSPLLIRSLLRFCSLFPSLAGRAVRRLNGPPSGFQMGHL